MRLPRPAGDRRTRRRALARLCLALACSQPFACFQPTSDPSHATRPRPDLLLVVWDTVRADRLSVYGYPVPTTPFLERFAEEARVYEDALSTAGSTVPSHASLFTGRLPGEHGAISNRNVLAGQRTLAEQLRDAGYRTYLFSANPHVSRDHALARGFEVAEHPWDEGYADEARRLVAAKLDDDDRSTSLRTRLEESAESIWDIKASGALAERGLRRWLERTDGSRPWFAVLNYMEAHRPYVPAREARQQVMDAGAVERSFAVDRSWYRTWSHVFGIAPYRDAELALIGSTYDATLVELDALFEGLLAGLEDDERLADAVVVLTSDHGEHLGEHGLLDHQYSLYDPLLRVPLLIRSPGRLSPGRDARPVVHYDVYATLRELAGLARETRTSPWRPRSLLATASSDDWKERPRFAEQLTVTAGPFRLATRQQPDFDPTPWARSLRSVVIGEHKLIQASDGHHELYARTTDPGEERDLHSERPSVVRRLEEALAPAVAAQEGLRAPSPRDAPTPAQRRRLEALGYLALPGDAP